MGPHEEKKLQKSVNKWFGKDRLIKESKFTHKPIKPKKPNLNLDKNKDKNGGGKVNVSGFIEPPSNTTGEDNATIGVGTSNISFTRIQPTKKNPYFSGTNELKATMPVNKKLSVGIRSEFNKNKKTINPHVSFKSSISNLFKKKKNKPKDFGYKH